MSGETHRGWAISKSFFGFWFQHPEFDPENATDWRHGYAATVQDARDEIDRLLAEDAEWVEASLIVAAQVAIEALRGVADDYQTSEVHHPNQVLIPVAKFEQLRAAAEAIYGK